ncbi:MAG: DUF3800 domain-containing protein [Rhabdochlamydiaceae bacterium]
MLPTELTTDMHLFFIDDAGSISPGKKIANNHFVLGGLVIPEDQWHNLERDFSQITRSFKIEGEIKWRFFGQKKGREDKENTLSHLTIVERDALRKRLLIAIAKYQSIKVIASVTHLPTIYQSSTIEDPEDIYFLTYKPLTEQFQYYLQDLSRKVGSKINGIVVCDHRNPAQDRDLRKKHAHLLNLDHFFKSRYDNLIEHLFLSPSHYSIGIQCADLISGAVFRRFEHCDERWYSLIESNFRKGENGEIKGYGLVKIPKGDWKENDAESSGILEPAIMTQSQRTPHDSLDGNY